MMAASGAAAVAVVLVALPWLIGLRVPARHPGPERRPPAAGRVTPSAPTPRRRPRTRPTGSVLTRGAERLDRRLRPVPPRGWIEALDQLARATSTGSSLASAVDEIGARADAPALLGEIARIRSGGVSLLDAIDHARHPSPVAADDRLALSVLFALAHGGGPPAEPLDRAAAVLRERRGAAAERDVAAAQSRLSAQVLGVLPVGATAWSATTDPALGHLLFRTPVGLGCLATGAALDLLGWRWMRRIVRSR